MGIKRTVIFDGLAARLRAKFGTTIASFSTRFRGGATGKIPTGDQPALDLVKGDELPGNDEGGMTPGVWTLTVNVWLYARSEDPLVGPAETLNELLDLLEDALAADDGERRFGPDTTLSGLPGVRRVQIESVETDGGSLGAQGVAHVVLSIEAHEQEASP